MSGILNSISSPEDVKKLSGEQVLQLNKEIREFLIENVSKSGGHLASNLGVVELTVALHRVFDSPKDRIIWDVGHQSYVHKILTGRKDEFSTLRSEGGLSGFTKRSESEHDPFGAGHSSTSVSAALGFVAADKLLSRGGRTIAVVGDGSFTGGMIYEAINNCSPDSKLIIVLNENEMSISRNVGNFAKHISKIRSTKKYLKVKSLIVRIVEKIPFIGQKTASFLSKLKDALKAAVYRTNFFEQFGLHYIGPIDGNDYPSLEMFLQEAKRREESCIVHIKTEKGHGYEDAKNNPEKYHSVPRVSEQTCALPQDSFSKTCSRALCEIARENERICAITAAMEGGTGLSQFRRLFPERFFDVGIAEEHAVVFGAGLSAGGMHPVFYIYSSFLQRAYDELLHDVSLQKLGMTLCIDRAGFATDDGATHHGIFDVAFLSHINGCEIYAPVAAKSLQNMLKLCVSNNKLSAIRYPKGYEDSQLLDAFYKCDEDYSDFNIKLAFDNDGRFEDKKYIIITYGNLALEALECAKELNEDKALCGVILMETLNPLEHQAQLIADVLPQGKANIVFAEEGIKNGGVGVSLLEKLTSYTKMQNKQYTVLAIDAELPETGSLQSLYKKCGISKDDMKKALLRSAYET